MDEKTLYHQVQPIMSGLVDGLSMDVLGSKTPCSDWDVRTLLNHIVGENLWIPELFAGKTIAEVGDRLDGDVLGSDPAGAWTKTSAQALEAIDTPGALERTVHLSFGDTKGSDYVLQMAIDQTIHAWDLATSLSRSVVWPEGHIEAIYDRFLPMAESWRGPGGIGPAVKVANDATTLSKLIALSGRDPKWVS